MPPVLQAAQGRTLAQVAHRLGVHPSAPWRWISRGVVAPSGGRLKLQAVRFPGGWRVRDEDLERFVAELNQAQPEQPAPRVEPSAPRPESLRAEAALAACGW